MIPSASPRSRKLRTDRLVLFGLLSLLTLFLVGYLLARRAREFSWPYLTNSVLLSFLGITNVILILTLLSLLIRNLIKVLSERRRNILGSRFKTRLVFTMLALWFVPSGIIFWAALHAIQGSVDRWFSTPVDRIATGSQAVVDAFYGDYKRRASASAGRMAQRMGSEKLLEPGSSEARIHQELEAMLRAERIDLVSLYRGDREPLTVADSALPRAGELEGVPSEVLERAFAGEPFQWISQLGSGKVVRVGAPVESSARRAEGVVVAGYFIPKDMAILTGQINGYAERYRQDKAQRRSIKNVYIFAFAFITLLVLFSVTWIGLYLARGVTEPIGMLAEGTREISSGNLDFRVQVRTRDELGILAESFNRMTAELKSSKETIEHSNQDLLRSNQELEERRRYIEALLQNITTGVISLDAEGVITTLNRAASRILGLEEGREKIGRRYAEVLPAELGDLREAVERGLRNHDLTPAREITVHVPGRTLTLAVSFSPLAGVRGGPPGLLIVLEDLTPLMRAQRVAAWREVARRLAHEIKNPLTPIQLSAQRILKKYKENSPELPEVLEQGTEAIVREVSALKRLVDEFSRFARLPAVNPVPCDLHALIDDTVSLYDGIGGALRFERRYDARMPKVALDPEQMKRVFVNLIDNARDAMGGAGTITFATAYHSEVEALRVEVSDDGPGIPPDDRERLFVPYFSTKKKGTGLGLAIVNRIISDHNGYIRAENNSPRGARFVIELPARKS